MEIAKIEEELGKEGTTKEKMRRLCDVHMAIFKERLEKQMPQMRLSQPVVQDLTDLKRLEGERRLLDLTD